MRLSAPIPDEETKHVLVGGFNPSEKYEFVSWDYSSQYVESHKIPWFQSPPSSNQCLACVLD